MITRLLCVAAGLLMAITAGCEDSGAGDAASTTPPAGAQFIEAEVTPEALAGWVWGHRGSDARRDAAATWADYWVPAPGWFGTVERVEDAADSTKAWFTYAAPANMGGNFWVAVEFPTMPRLAPAQGVTFSGRIEKVEYLTPSGVPELRIVIRNATVNAP